MVLNANCTVIRTDDNGEYRIINTYPCMWQETNGYTARNFGEEKTTGAKIYIPNVNADVNKGDYVVKGAPDSPDITNALAVTAVTRHDYGSAAMQHIRVIAE